MKTLSEHIQENSEMKNITEGALSLDKDETKIMNKIAAYIKQYDLTNDVSEKIFQNLVIASKHNMLKGYSSAAMDKF